MHKKVAPDKLGKGRRGRRSEVPGPTSHHNAATVKPGRGQPDSVKSILARATPVLAGIARRAEAQQGLEAWSRAHLPVDLAGHVTEVLEKEGELTLFAESAAWAGRLRFEVAALLAGLAGAHPHIKRVRVKVMPRGTRG